MNLGELAKGFGEKLVEAVKGAVISALKPLLKEFSQDLINLLKAEAAKTSTPIDDMVIAAAQPGVEKMVDDLLAKI